MWTAQREELPNACGLRFTLDRDTGPAAYADVLAGWQNDASFRTFFNALLADYPFSTFLWLSVLCAARTTIWQGGKAMSDVKRYVQQRAERDVEFAENYDAGYVDFKIGVILRQAREAAGLTQADVAQRLQTQKSAISRIENHADDVRLSTIRRYAEAVGASLHIRLATSQGA